MHSLRYAFRTLTKAPGLSLVVILSIAIGIGANVTIFSWLGAALFRPLPAVTADMLALEARDKSGAYITSSWLEYRDLRERMKSSVEIIAQRPRALHLDGEGSDERVWSELVSDNFFSALGVRPARGRFFSPEEATQPGGAPVAVISDALWHTRFSSAEDVIGRTLRLNNRDFTIIGVAPARFKGAITGLGFDLWVPLTMAAELRPFTRELTARSNRGYMLNAVLRPDVSRAQAEGALAVTARALAAEFPDENKGVSFELMPIWRSPRSGVRITAALGTLQVFALLVLIVVCVNTANLLLARASVRQREIGIHLAVGAGSMRVVRLLLTESVLLALAGATGGLLLAAWSVDLIRTIDLPTTGVPLRLEVAFDWTSAALSMGLATACGMLFGLAPALQLARSDVQHALRGGRGSIGGRSRLRNALIASEVAVALVVLVLAGLFLKSFRNAQNLNPGYAVDRVLLASVDPAGRGYDRPAMRRFVRDVVARLQALPGVESASVANVVPLDFRGFLNGPVEIDGQVSADDQARILSYTVAPGYLATMKIPILEGTDLAPMDQTDRPADAVINAEMARRFWPGISPIGHHFKFDGDKLQVVGVAAVSKYETLAESPQPLAWASARNGTMYAPTLHVRVRGGDPLAILPEVREAIRGLDSNLSLFDVHTFTQQVDNSLYNLRVPAEMLAFLGPLALVLAAIGLYAVLSYSLAQRTQEIGVRLTLGATPASVVALMVREGMRFVFVGTVLGLIGALGCGWYLRHRLIGVPLGDPIVYVGVPALLLAVAALACWLPARRATRVDPLEALRSE